MQKVEFISGAYLNNVNGYLEDGWRVVNIFPVCNEYGSMAYVLLEKNDNVSQCPNSSGEISLTF